MPENTAEAILEATEELVREVMERNSLVGRGHGELHLHLHRATSTPSSPPWPRATSGSSAVPLLCTREIDVPGRAAAARSG